MFFTPSIKSRILKEVNNRIEIAQEQYDKEVAEINDKVISDLDLIRTSAQTARIQAADRAVRSVISSLGGIV